MINDEEMENTETIDQKKDNMENIFMVEYHCLSCLKNEGVYGNGACVYCGYMFCGCYDMCICIC